MKLSKTLSFNRQNLRIEGFTDLGKHTPEHQKGKKGDHALVLMFQPFKGKWVQTLGCFLSKGSASGTVLHKIIMECVVLAENAGLRIDAVATDGASWNRAMWNMFGVTEKDVGIVHIVDPSRRLWFFSDFPHLIKCIRNFFTKHKKYDAIWTPDGLVSLMHWFALLALEDPRSYDVKVNYKLRQEHIQPKYYQKMNVALAFQFFGVADSLEIFRNRHNDLKECDGSIKFCRKMKSLIDAMNTRTPMNALAPSNAAWQTITDFLVYLDEWEKTAKEREYEFITENSCYGLKVSLRATLELCSFLVEKCGFKYLMTARVNQDNLERFFGMMRDCCGSNDHPDSSLFIQMYRLISTYSLVQPPKGCNVSGSELLNVLLTIKDIENGDDRKEQWEAQVDTILDAGCQSNHLTDAFALLQDHNYHQSEALDYAISYISGYVSRKGSRFAKFIYEKKPVICDNCISTLVLAPNDSIPERHKLIELRSKGFLKHPSVKLYDLICILEKATMQVVGNADINADNLFQITTALEQLSPIPFVGCEQHQLLLTRSILSFYLTTRMHFVCKQSNKNDNEEQKITKENRKLAKLVNIPESKKQQENCETSRKPAMKRKICSKERQIPSKKGKTILQNIQNITENH